MNNSLHTVKHFLYLVRRFNNFKFEIAKNNNVSSRYNKIKLG